MPLLKIIDSYIGSRHCSCFEWFFRQTPSTSTEGLFGIDCERISLHRELLGSGLVHVKTANGRHGEMKRSGLCAARDYDVDLIVVVFKAWTLHDHSVLQSVCLSVRLSVCNKHALRRQRAVNYSCDAHNDRTRPWSLDRAEDIVSPALAR